MNDRCDAKIAPFNDKSKVIRCEDDMHHGGYHGGAIRGMAGPGTASVVSWAETDRRNFRGDFVMCMKGDGLCVLPARHEGRCEL
ncbi:MAG: hypothetical protein KGL39_04240 [Patescibacteria group bacterium]|nr:hypothetical protein [Patescibacteria group bacterium]